MSLSLEDREKKGVLSAQDLRTKLSLSLTRGQGQERRLVSAGLRVEDQIVRVTRGEEKEKHLVSAGLEDQIVLVTHMDRKSVLSAQD